MSIKINWEQHLAVYAGLLSKNPISVAEYCEEYGLPFGTAKRHISMKKARLFKGSPAKMSGTQKKVPAKKQKKRSSKESGTIQAKLGAPKGNLNARLTGCNDRLEDIPAETVKAGVLAMTTRGDGITPLERQLIVLHAQFENVLRSQANMHGGINEIYDPNEVLTKEVWNEGDTHILKTFKCDAITATALANLADTISNVHKRQAEILLKERELSTFTLSRREELRLIEGAFEKRKNLGLSAMETVRLIEIYGAKPPVSLIKEMEKEITFIEPESPDTGGITDEDLDKEVGSFMDSLGAEAAAMHLQESSFAGGIDVGHDNEDTVLDESDFV